MGDLEDFLAFILLLVGAAAVISIIDNATKSPRYECPNCRTILSKGVSPCPKCGTPIRW